MPDLEPAGPSRRTLLRNIAVVGGIVVAGGALAACGGGDDSSSSGQASATTDTPSPEATTDTPSPEATTDTPSPEATTDTPTPDAPSDSPTTNTPAAPTGTEIAAASAIAVGSGKIFKSPQVVVTQPTEGDFKAFSSICTHQACPVSQIIENTIVCNCHGSEFSFEDGSVIRGPATRPLPKKKVTEANGKIFVS